MTRPVLELDHAFITIPQGAEEEARRFYGEVLGLEEIARPEGLSASSGLWFRAGARELHLGADDAHAAHKRPHPGFRAAGFEELDGLAGRVEQAGFEVAWDDRIEGRRRFYTRDPFGNRVEVLADG
ncbi:MAG TPA: VOC family protein [Gaiellaceae bacterium]|nr:VOC family protein [Gaiellaceae bacterium]